MLVPLLLGALCHTFTPWAGKYFGSFTNGLITGTVPILAVWFFCMGASINYRSAGVVLRKSGTIVFTKIVVAWIVGFLCVMFMPKGMIQAGFFAGLSTSQWISLAVLAGLALTSDRRRPAADPARSSTTATRRRYRWAMTPSSS